MEEIKTVTPEEKQATKTELLRGLSKDLGINLFDAEGIAKFKEFTESQKTESMKLQEKITQLESDRSNWQTEKLTMLSKLKATELGIDNDKLEDALKLAGNDPEKLGEVVKKYPTFKAKNGVQIGVTSKDKVTNLNGLTEAEIYKLNNPRIYGK